jgi:hypothetical protein
MTTEPSQRLAQGRNLRTRLGLSAGQALKFCLGLIDCVGEKVLLVGPCQAERWYMAHAARATSLLPDTTASLRGKRLSW